MSDKEKKASEKKDIDKNTSEKNSSGKKKSFGFLRKLNIEDYRAYMNVINFLTVVFGFIGIFLITRFVVNEIFKAGYNNDSYYERLETMETYVVNTPEGYVPYYNLGNAEYKQERYAEAVGYYTLALEYEPSVKKQIPIRINLALAMVHTIDFDDLDTNEKIGRAISQLVAARDVLCQNGIADMNDKDYISPEAQQLKKDIDKMIEELMKNYEPPTNNDSEEDEQQEEQQDQQQNQQQQNKTETQREKEVREKLQKQMEESLQERRDADDQKSQQTGGGSGSDDGEGSGYDGRNW